MGQTARNLTPRHEADPMHGFASEAEFFRAVLQAGKGARIDDRLQPLRIKAAVGSDEQSGIADEFGGFAVPKSIAGDVLSAPNELDPTIGRTRTVRMGTPTVGVVARTDKNHSTSVTGGITVTRRPETVSPATSRMEMEQVVLQATTQMGLTYASRELVSDSRITFSDLIGSAYRDEMATEAFDERLNGSGVGEPEGVMNSPALLVVAKEVAQVADTLNGTNLINMRDRCWRSNQAMWIANHNTLPQLAAAHLAGTNSDIFLFQPTRREDVPDMLLGRPVFFSEFMAPLGDQGDIALINWREYLDGEYQPIQQESSIHVRWDNHEEVFKVWRRNDGRGWWRSVLTPRNGSTLSPYITLAERA